MRKLETLTWESKSSQAWVWERGANGAGRPSEVSTSWFWEVLYLDRQKTLLPWQGLSQLQGLKSGVQELQGALFTSSLLGSTIPSPRSLWSLTKSSRTGGLEGPLAAVTVGR